MAINIQSGQTWAEIRAEINNKAFDKNGDTLLGSITDSNGNEALKIDVNNQKIYSYAVDGESHYGELLGVGSGDYSVTIPKGMKRGICCINTASRESTSSGKSLLAIMYFNKNSTQSKLFGWLENYDFREMNEQASNNSMYANAYINGEKLEIHISSYGCSRGTLNIFWEVW